MSHNDVYFITRESQSSRQILQVEETIPLRSTSFSSTRLFKLWRKLQMILKKKTFFTRSCSIDSTFIHSNSSLPKLLDQIDSYFQMNNLVIHLLIQIHSQDTFHEHKDIVAEKFQIEVIKVFTSTEVAKSTEIESFTNNTFSAPHEHFRNLEKFAYKPATHYPPLKLDVDGDFSSKNDKLQVNDASSDYIQSYSAAIPRKDPSGLMPKFILDSYSTHSFQHNDWQSSQKIKSARMSCTQYFI